MLMRSRALFVPENDLGLDLQTTALEPLFEFV
jgi:hypothetical protein